MNSNLRRTGRTTVMLADALSKLISTGECNLYDHTFGIDMTSNMKRWLLNEFIDRLNGFFHKEQDFKMEWFDIKYLTKDQCYNVKINKKHPFYEITKNRVINDNGEVIKWCQ